jgi:hypothetical protein
MEVSGQLHASAALPPGIEPPVPFGYDAEWASVLVWTLWRRENSLASAVNRTSAAQPVVRPIPAELSGSFRMIRLKIT